MGLYGTGDEAFFDRVARLYDGLMPAARGGSLAAGLRFADRPIRRVVDVAGGTGRAARAVRETTDASVTVCDISAGMLARAATDGFGVVRGDARRLPIRTASVDAVVIVDALHHVPDPATALGELVRVLAPGGVVVVRDFDPGTVIGAAIAAGERLVGMESALLGPDAVVRALRDAGVRAYTIDNGWTYTVVGVRPRTDATSTRAAESVNTPADR